MKKLSKIRDVIAATVETLSIDWVASCLAVFLSIVGIMTIYSATRTPLGENQPEFYLKQIVWLMIGLLLMMALSAVGYKRLQRIALPIYVIAVILLIFTIFVGHTGMGAKRWLRFGPVNLQPSEVLRLATILALSFFLSKISGPLRLKHFAFIMIVFVLFPSIVYYLQPDLGSSVLLCFIVLFMLAIKGLQKRLAIGLVIISLLSGVILGPVFWNYLKPYQKNRIVAFLEPEADPTGIGYQITQSKVTIGSGRWFGKGY
ncbi:MAG: rod shape-determining protein RodA, partial [Nitrospirae bacterium]